MPHIFGLTEERAELLPDITNEDLVNLSEFLTAKLDDFAFVNNRFLTMKTTFSHSIVSNSKEYPFVREYILNFLKK